MEFMLALIFALLVVNFSIVLLMVRRNRNVSAQIHALGTGLQDSTHAA